MSTNAAPPPRRVLIQRRPPPPLAHELPANVPAAPLFRPPNPKTPQKLRNLRASSIPPPEHPPPRMPIKSYYVNILKMHGERPKPPTTEPPFKRDMTKLKPNKPFEQEINPIVSIVMMRSDVDEQLKMLEEYETELLDKIDNASKTQGPEYQKYF
jgi:hypothetical protein